MIIKFASREFCIRPSWVVVGDDTGMELSDIIAISLAMQPVEFTTDGPFEYRKVGLAVYDGLMYSPTVRARTRRGIPEDERPSRFPLSLQVPNFRTEFVYPQSVFDAIGLSDDGRRWRIISSIYGLPPTWEVYRSADETRSLLLDCQIGMTPAVPSALHIVLGNLDETRADRLRSYLRLLGLPEGPIRMEYVRDWYIQDIIIGSLSYRSLPPQDRFAAAIVMLGIAADFLAAHRGEEGAFIILEYPEITDEIGVIIDLIENTPLVQWIVISRFDIPTRLPVVRY